MRDEVEEDRGLQSIASIWRDDESEGSKKKWHGNMEIYLLNPMVIARIIKPFCIYFSFSSRPCRSSSELWLLSRRGRFFREHLAPRLCQSNGCYTFLYKSSGKDFLGEKCLPIPDHQYSERLKNIAQSITIVRDTTSDRNNPSWATHPFVSVRKYPSDTKKVGSPQCNLM